MNDKVKVTKWNIVRALETEPLMRDQWIDPLANDQATCRVCAVGAVVRRTCGVLGWANHMDRCEEATQHQYMSGHRAPYGNYLSALSIVWEYLNKHNDVASPEVLRPDIIRWAQDNIPNNYVTYI